MSKHEYRYTIMLNGKKINYKNREYKKLIASSERIAKTQLYIFFPHCKIIKLETKTGKHFDTSNSQFGSAIFL